MGIFSKKTVVCERCGKEYQTRLAFGVNICDACYEKEYEEEEAEKQNRVQKETEIPGYIRYRKLQGKEPYPIETLDEIIEHRDRILQKISLSNGISPAELKDAYSVWLNKTEDEKNEIYTRINRSALQCNYGVVYNKTISFDLPGFFLPTGFDGTIVEADSIFAVAYAKDYGHSITVDSEPFLCAVFTNDPFIPAFPVVFVGRVGLLDLSLKSKEGRAAAEAFFKVACKNLKYPVIDVKDLKSTIIRDRVVKGNLKRDEMLDLIDKAKWNNGVFETKDISMFMPPKTKSMIAQCGYCNESDLMKYVHLDEDAYDMSFMRIGCDALIKNENTATEKAFFCRECGSRLSDGAHFCMKCGAKVG